MVEKLSCLRCATLQNLQAIAIEQNRPDIEYIHRSNNNDSVSEE
jgi:hypothetical protein